MGPMIGTGMGLMVLVLFAAGGKFAPGDDDLADDEGPDGGAEAGGDDDGAVIQEMGFGRVLSPGNRG